MALGYVMRLPEKDELNKKLDKLKADFVVAMGGRIAEEIVFGKDKITSGAAGDIQSITYWARRMVTEWGMSEKLGKIRYNSDSEEVFLGHSVAQSKNLSDSTATKIDDEIRNLVDEAENKCRKILTENIEELHTIAKGLLEYETLSGEEVNNLLKGIQPSRENFDDYDSGNMPEPSGSVPNTGSTLKPGQSTI